VALLHTLLETLDIVLAAPLIPPPFLSTVAFILPHASEVLLFKLFHESLTLLFTFSVDSFVLLLIPSHLSFIDFFTFSQASFVLAFIPSHFSLIAFPNSPAFSFTLSQFLYKAIPAATAPAIAITAIPIGLVKNPIAAPNPLVTNAPTFATPFHTIVAAVIPLVATVLT